MLWCARASLGMLAAFEVLADEPVGEMVLNSAELGVPPLLDETETVLPVLANLDGVVAASMGDETAGMLVSKDFLEVVRATTAGSSGKGEMDRPPSAATAAAAVDGDNCGPGPASCASALLSIGFEHGERCCCA